MSDTETKGQIVHLDLSEEQLLLQQTVRRFAEEEVRPRAAKMDATGQFDLRLWEQMKALGLCGLPVSDEYGGAGMDGLSYVVAIEELARVCGSTALTLGVHVSLGTDPIACFGDENQRQRYLPDLAAGERIAALAMTEPTAGSDAAGTKTSAVRRGDHYVLNGTKSFVTNANIGHVFFVTARTSPEPGTSGITTFIVDKSSPGFGLGRSPEKLGMRASDWADVTFEDCRVPVANRVGEEGDGFRIFMKTVDAARIATGALALGLAQGAFERALKYAKERTTFGKRIADHQAIGFKLADMAVRIEASRHLVYEAARLRDAGRPYGMKASMAKLFCSEAAMRVTYDAIQVLGGYGYSREYEVERFWRDAKLCTIGEGTSEIQRIVISRNLLKET